MLDIKFIRENPELVKENIKKKFQDQKLPLVDEVIELDAQRRAAIVEADQLRSNRNSLSQKSASRKPYGSKSHGRCLYSNGRNHQHRPEKHHFSHSIHPFFP